MAFHQHSSYLSGLIIHQVVPFRSLLSTDSNLHVCRLLSLLSVIAALVYVGLVFEIITTTQKDAKSTNQFKVLIKAHFSKHTFFFLVKCLSLCTLNMLNGIVILHLIYLNI